VSVLNAMPVASVRSPGIPAQGRGLLGQVGQENLRLSATRGPGDGCHVVGSRGQDRVELSVAADGVGASIQGYGPGGQVDLIRRQQGNSSDPMVTGTIGGRPVQLELRGWSRSEATVTGYVGDQRVQITQRRQLDGHMLSGYLGSQRFTLKEREMPGDGVSLQPIEYLAALVKPESNFLANRWL